MKKDVEPLPNAVKAYHSLLTQWECFYAKDVYIHLTHRVSSQNSRFASSGSSTAFWAIFTKKPVCSQNEHTANIQLYINNAKRCVTFFTYGSSINLQF